MVKPPASLSSTSNWFQVRQMYVFEGKGMPEISMLLGIPKSNIRRRLVKMGVELRTKTSIRSCRICGKPAFKRTYHNGTSWVLSGTLCYDHTREMWRHKNLARRFKVLAQKAGAVQDKRFLGKELSTSPHFVYSNTQGLADEQREAL